MLNEKIATLRKNKKVSQEELADILLTSRQAVSKWERGESYPDIDRLKDLAIYFNVSIDYLLDYDIQAVSVKGFMDRLDNCVKNRKFDIPVEEIRMVVSKNNNNFDLLVKAIEYLVDFWSISRDPKLIDMATDYCKKAIILYQPNSKSKITLKDLQSLIGESLMIKGDYEATRTYFKENNISGFETLLAHCNVQLGNYNEAKDIIAENYLQSITRLIDGNMAYIILLTKTNEFGKVYELCNWTISFIRSIAKTEDFYQDVIFLLTFIKACSEAYLKMDNSDSINYLISKRDCVGINNDSSNNLKFYDNKEVTFVALVSDVKNSILKEIYDENSGDDKQIAKEIYEKVFKE